jgi:hypothetical protein
MASVPLKPRYGPTLGKLLEPRWRTASPLARGIARIVAIVLAALAVAVVLTLLDASYSHGGPVPFSFKYKGLYKTKPEPGGYVKVARSGAQGRLEDSFAVAPLRIGAYEGSVTGELPLVATGYAQTLTRRFSGFRLEGEGKTRITSTLAGYEVLYRVTIAGQEVHGRDIMLLPPRQDARQGVVIEMLSDEPASVSKPVASSGVLERPLKTFSFG